MTTDFLLQIGRLASDREIDALLLANKDAIDVDLLHAIGGRGQEAEEAGERELARSYFYAGHAMAKLLGLWFEQAHFAILVGQVIRGSGREGAEPWFRETIELVSPELETNDGL